jgi:putative salt-induced outer membrane protein YdiY
LPPVAPVDQEVEILPPPVPQVEAPLPALIDESIPWYAPGFWYDAKLWEGSFELGINSTVGNSEAFSFRTGANLKRTTEQETLAIDVTYAKAMAGTRITQDNALANVTSEWRLGESPWSWVGKFTTEFDEFKAFDVRIVLNSAIGYRFIKTDTTRFAARFGSGFSREIGGPDSKYVPEAVFGVEFERSLSKRQKLFAKVDYLPDWTEFQNFRLQTNAGWEVVIDSEANLSLKLSVIDRYDSTPNGRKPNDLNYSLLLLWKF